MHAEYLLIHEGSHWQTIKYITEYSPELDGVSSLALVVETVDPVDLSALVIASEHEEVLWVLYLVAEHEDDGLN